MKSIIFVFFISTLGVAQNGFGACRIYHVDHDGSPYTNLQMRVACDQTFDTRRVPKYIIHPKLAVNPQSTIREPDHFSLPKHKNECKIRNFYQFTQMQIISGCIIK